MRKIIIEKDIFSKFPGFKRGLILISDIENSFVNEKIEGNLCLGFAKGNEIFVPLSSHQEENPEPGEVIYYDDKTLNVMCRKWNWRNGDFSKITENTKKMVINVDGADIVPESLIKEARDELAELLKENCRASLTIDLLNSKKNEIVINL